jgi:DNA polymerase IV
MERPLSIRTYPQAIIHIDADSFFASCEQAVNPALRGKPVITGKERGIASAVSYEAKALGVKREMSVREIQKICPDIIYLPSDYETYSLFSQRMFEVVRRYTGAVEEYSIDECFAELTGLRRSLRMGYEDIARTIQRELIDELGMGFSVGLAPTKVLAKLASKKRKPRGFVAVPGRDIHHFLEGVPVGEVWGIGEQTQKYLKQFRITTALQFAQQSEEWVRSTLTKPHIALWHELRGTAVLEVETGERADYQSISKTKTFTPPTGDRATILSQLSKNVENACIKARRHGLAASRVFFLLRTQDYRHSGGEFQLSTKTAHPSAIVSLIDARLDSLMRTNTRYRATGVTLAGLERDQPCQLDLFGAEEVTEKFRRVFDAIDVLDRAYGKHTVFLGTSMGALTGRQYAGDRSDTTARSRTLFPGEGARKHLGFPMLGDVG